MLSPLEADVRERDTVDIARRFRKQKMRPTRFGQMCANHWGLYSWLIKSHPAIWFVFIQAVQSPTLDIVVMTSAPVTRLIHYSVPKIAKLTRTVSALRGIPEIDVGSTTNWREAVITTLINLSSIWRNASLSRKSWYRHHRNQNVRTKTFTNFWVTFLRT